MWIVKNRKRIIVLFVMMALLSIAALPFLNFAFDFEKFFPDGDRDLEYYKEFVEEFESDDNYLLIAIEKEPDVFDPKFLNDVKLLTQDLPSLYAVNSAISLPTIQKPKLGIMGLTFSPFFSLEDPELKLKFKKLSEVQKSLKSVVASNSKSLVIALKVEEHLEIKESLSLIQNVNSLIKKYQFNNFHLLGRTYFQNELARLQATEVLYSSVFSFGVVSLILFLLYRNKYLIFITLVSITLGLLLFMGLLSILGRELDAMSALYPVLMLIVGSSDVIHILSKYLDELRKGNKIEIALNTTIRQIGLATLFTSVTTAIGFISLVTSRIGPVRGFGLNAAIGVIVAYITIIFFTTALLTYFSPDKLKTHVSTFLLWDKAALWFYKISKHHIAIFTFTAFLLTVCVYGISLISTDYKIESSLPVGKKVTEDFLFFEKNYAGYRPLEYVVSKKDKSSILDQDGYETVRSISSIIEASPHVDQVTSFASIVEPLWSFSPIGSTKIEIEKIKPLLSSFIKNMPTVIINEQGDKTRLTAQIKDVGAYKIKELTTGVYEWYLANIDTTAFALNYTGTGLIIDKNAVYVRESLFKGLGLALVIIGILMGILFRSVKMVFISLIPNAIPLIIAGAILGFSDVPLEPLTSITFVVIFGIAVDDTIHFLSKYKLALHSGLSIEESIKVSFEESGKAILFTTVVLFFGFLVMLFSYNPGSVIVGGLISITLFTAVFADLILLPVLLRLFKIR